MCSIKSTDKGTRFELPNWLAGVFAAILLAWIGWVSTSLIEYAERFSLLKVQQANTTLSPDTKAWLDARFSHLTTQVAHVAQTQAAIKADIKDLDKRVDGIIRGEK